MNTELNPYAAPSVAAFLPGGAVSDDLPFVVRAVEPALLRRRFVLDRNGREWLLEYSGRGIRDTIRVNGHPVVRKIAWVWFVPRFSFPLDGLPATIEVEISPLLAIRRFELTVDGRSIYREFVKSSSRTARML